MPPVLPSEEHLSLDSEEPDTGKIQDEQTTTPSIDKEQPVSAGKKKVVFLSEWPQEKLNAEQNFTLKQLVEVSM